MQRRSGLFLKGSEAWLRVLRVLLDGEPMPEADARVFWRRFSDWMDAHRGDLAGFASREGMASVHPELIDGHPVLIASRTAPQRPYTAVSPTPSRRRGRPPNRGGRKR